MIEVTIVLPTTDNDGKTLVAEITGLLVRVLDIAGGYSLVEQVGAWKDENGKVYVDKSTRVTTVVNGDLVEKLRLLAYNAAVVLRQEAIFFQTRPVVVEFIPGIAKEPELTDDDVVYPWETTGRVGNEVTDAEEGGCDGPYDEPDDHEFDESVYMNEYTA